MGLDAAPAGYRLRAVDDNLLLSLGWLGRDKCGLMPIRGHSGVQGGAEMGAYATMLPGGKIVDEDNAAYFSEMYGFPIGSRPGLDSVRMLRAAERGELDVFHIMGGNFLETMPGRRAVEKSLSNIPLRVHQDIVLTNQMLVEPGEEVILLPAMTRYEQPGGGTETTTERRVAFSPEIRGPRIGEARAEWRIFMDIAAARASRTQAPDRLSPTAQSIRKKSRAPTRPTTASRT
jgi:predicted molibdopterin-dependent oxidoreductase YjgC